MSVKGKRVTLVAIILITFMNVYILMNRSAEAALKKEYDTRVENVITDEWCTGFMGGKRARFYEYKRYLAEVDCLTSEYAIEAQNAPTWHQAPGQALWYALLWRRKPAIMLIIRSMKEEKYLVRLKKLLAGVEPPEHYGIVGTLKIRIFVVRVY